ncbi:hypothetical protein ACH5RR_026931 [Cinchona calisaya]|uniref:Uncharacterized protein n=1 Tax=Cinchona calisaya TaxID=153742 RepID=A0ABD2Z408_9GENT
MVGKNTLEKEAVIGNKNPTNAGASTQVSKEGKDTTAVAQNDEPIDVNPATTTTSNYQGFSAAPCEGNRVSFTPIRTARVAVEFSEYDEIAAIVLSRKNTAATTVKTSGTATNINNETTGTDDKITVITGEINL